MPPSTPADVLAERRRAILSKDADGFADLFASDAVLETPFAALPGGAPTRIQGRAAIRESARQFAASPVTIDDVEVIELYQTQDPEVVVVELSTKGTVSPAGRPFAATSIQVLRIRDGQIVLFRDFADPRLLHDLLPHLDDLSHTG
jgi:uncharacterized protein (TIGR02246 family)